MNKKFLAGALACALVFGAGVGATLAWLQDTSNTVTNTFTAGKVVITLDEEDVDEYGVDVNSATQRVQGNEYKSIPGQTYVKDPTVHVAVGSEPSYLFVEVVNELGTKEVASDLGTIAEQMVKNGWTRQGTSNIWKYNTTVDARTAAKDVKVFDKFTLSSALTAGEDGVLNLSEKITIRAFAVQSANITDAEALTAAQTAFN